MLFRSGAAPRAEPIFRAVAAAADPVRQPALRANAQLQLTALLLREDRYEAAEGPGLEAVELFRRSGESEYEGTALYALSTMKFSMREVDEGYELGHRALQRLGLHRASYRLHNLLSSLAETAAEDGFTRTAIRLQDEAVRVAERTGLPAFVAEARLTRARLLASEGALGRAREDVAAGEAAAGRLADRTTRDWMTAERQMVAPLRSAPARAGASLDSAGAFFLRMNVPLRALPARIEAARAWLAAGETARAAARLDQALAILENRRDSIRMEPRRAAVFGAAEGVVERMVMLKLASGDAAGALDYLDRGRASLAPTAASDATGPRGASAGVPGEVALVHALVADTLLAWTVVGGTVQVTRSVVDTLQLQATLEQLRERLQRSAGAAELRPSLARLHAWLIRPVQSRLGAPGTPLVVVLDGDLAAVPLAALYDPRTGRYLVQDHPTRSAVSLREARRRGARGGSPKPALLVADPAFDPAASPGFARLREAAAEVERIAIGYPGARVISGPGADPRTVRAGLARAGLLHYAGHAVFDDERPELSHLLLAVRPGRRGPARLTAEQIAQLDLRHLSLVVLAACQTVRTGPGRAAGFSGLAGAFLAAGAGGVLGSLWEVDDRATRSLMVEFHDAYRATGDAPAALRRAQLELLSSEDAALRTPAAWAGFRYVGE